MGKEHVTQIAVSIQRACISAKERQYCCTGNFGGILDTVPMKSSWGMCLLGYHLRILLLKGPVAWVMLCGGCSVTQSRPTLCDPNACSAGLLCPWDSPGTNPGVGGHFLLQCMKVKSESEVAHSCPTLRDPMDCSPPGSSIHGILQARVLEWGAIAFSE